MTKVFFSKLAFPSFSTFMALVFLDIAAPDQEHNILVVGINLITGVLGVPLITWLKQKTGLRDGWAYLLAATVATLLAIGQLLITRQLNLENVLLDNFYEVFTSVFFISNAIYRAMSEYTKAGGLG